MNTYVTRRITVDAVMYDGVNSLEIESFVSPDNIRFMETGGIQVDTGELWVTVEPGWWVTKDTTTAVLTVHRARAFSRFFRSAVAGASD